MELSLLRLITSRLGPVSWQEEDEKLWLAEQFDKWEDEVKLKDDDGSAELAINNLLKNRFVLVRGNF